MSQCQLTDEYRQTILELHKTAEGKVKFANCLADNVCKQLDLRSVPRQLLKVERLAPGALPIYDKQLSDKFYFANFNDSDYDVTRDNTNRIVIPQFEINASVTTTSEQLRSEVLAAIFNFDERIFKEIQRKEFNLFLNLLKANYEDCKDDDVREFPCDINVAIRNFKLIFSSSNKDDVANYARSVNAKFFIVDFLEAGEYFAVKDFLGFMPISIESCLPADNPPMLGYTYFEHIGMACVFDSVKLIDREIWNNTHIDKFKFMMSV